MAISVQSKTHQKESINQNLIQKIQKELVSNSQFIQARNAVCTTSVNKLAINRNAVQKTDRIFSHHLSENKITNQNSSGRCWLFAATNLLRFNIINKYKLKEDFELSQTYLHFWDKFERSNYFLESIIETLDEPIDSRLTSFLLEYPVADGGQWHMCTSLIKKYGVVPKFAMPESESSSNTRVLNTLLASMLREYAAVLRGMHESRKNLIDLRETKKCFLGEIYRIIATHYGEPPKEFLWQWRDKDKKFFREGSITPQDFYQKFFSIDLNDYICLIHCPQTSKKLNTCYTIKFLGNVIDGDMIRYLNVDLNTMKNAAIQQIQDNEPVWFGCDMGPQIDKQLGLMDINIFQYELIYGTKPTLSKAQRLDYGESRMSHAMIFTGVDLDELKKPRKWRVENSWGEASGDKGFYIMNDNWFDEYMYEVAVNKKYLSPDQLKAFEKEPIALEPWDPMGALAL